MSSNIKCPLCHNKFSAQKLYQVSKQNYFNERNFAYFLCKMCQVAFLYPRITKKDIYQIYKGKYFSFQHKPGNKLIDFILSWGLAPYDKFICQVVKSGRKLLDVGCGYGDFLFKMQNRGWDVYGIEPFLDAVKVGRKRVGEERILKGELPKVKFRSKNFDVVTLWGVLEHLPNPSIYISKIHNLLRKRGYLIIEIPNLDSFLLSIFGNNYNWLSINEHVFIYSKKGVKKFLNDNGFSTLSVYSPVKITSNFAINMANLVSNRYFLNWDLTMLFFLPISFLVSLFMSLLGRGEVIRIIARKI